MARERFNIYTNDEALAKLITSQPNQSEFIESELLKIINGDYVDRKEAEDSRTLDNDYKKLRNEHLGIKIKIDGKKLSYMNTFDAEPSNEANKAIIDGEKTHREFSESEKENVTKYITLRKDSQNSLLWIAKCDLCHEGESYQSYDEALHDMVRHLTTEHSKKVMVLQR